MTQIVSYKNLFLQLLPQGPIWQSRDPYIKAFAGALGEELDVLYTKFQEMKFNLSVQNASALLPEWERDVGIPDDCLKVSEHENIRRQNILMRIYERQHTTLPWLNKVLQQFDSQARAEESASAQLTVYHQQGESYHARAGQVRAGERLFAVVNDRSFECYLHRRLPAHIKITFNFAAIRETA